MFGVEDVSKFNGRGEYINEKGKSSMRFWLKMGINPL